MQGAIIMFSGFLKKELRTTKEKQPYSRSRVLLLRDQGSMCFCVNLPLAPRPSDTFRETGYAYHQRHIRVPRGEESDSEGGAK
jgi:hypothetical protein